MSKSTTLIIGILATIAIFGIAYLSSYIVNFDSDFIAPSFFTHTVMMVISVIIIILLVKKGIIIFPFKKVKFKYYLFAFITTIVAIIIANVLATIILKITGHSIDPSGKGHAVVASYSSLQFFIFIFLYASICEEFLFRGFTLNVLAPLKSYGFRVNEGIFISIPVILSGILFGLAHLVLLNTETSGPVVFRIVIFTTFLGLVAGYFQEKHKSILPAIIIHMIGNLPGLIMSFL